MISLQACVDQWGRLCFNSLGMPAAVMDLWVLLTDKGHMGFQINSRLEAKPLVADVLLFCLWLETQHHAMFYDFGRELMANLVSLAGCALVSLACTYVAEQSSGSRPLAALPRLKCKVRFRKSDPVNRFLASDKIKNHILSTAMRWSGRAMVGELVSKCLGRLEDLMLVSLYLEIGRQTLSNCMDISLNWDGSNHAGQEINLYIAWGKQADKSAYLTLQGLSPVRASELTGIVDFKICRPSLALVVV